MTLPVLADRLGAFLDAACDDPRRFGPSPCLLFCADWVREISGRDPAEPWRESYRDGFSAARIVARFGGVRALAEQAMRLAGFPVTEAPGVGDIGMIGGVGGDGEDLIFAGAICSAPGLWAALTPRGLMEAYVEPVIAWSVARTAGGDACRI